ncbi:DUF6349 family protein [Streptomyces sp. NPDC059352]|uniref:DUF6349 family protein n=1 Tax=Streptomyces sp. NPDC059352 TaxID=3346810 RepID=UPI00368374DC
MQRPVRNRSSNISYSAGRSLVLRVPYAPGAPGTTSFRTGRSRPRPCVRSGERSPGCPVPGWRWSWRSPHLPERRRSGRARRDEAIEDAHDHTHPGWRDLAIFERSRTGKAGGTRG